MTETRQAFRTEVSRLLDIVVHSLYSEREVFLRELISNASDACDKLRYTSLTQPELLPEGADFKIRITADPKARTLTVSDNGIGMDRDELIENLGTIARSGTADFLEKLKDQPKGDLNVIGQFGVGFYAAFMVAQMVEVKSRKAGTQESWAWRSDGKGEFAVEEDPKTTTGTDVVLYLKEDASDYLLEERLNATVVRYSDHIAIPILIGDSETTANNASALWMRTKSDITEDQYKEFYHHVARSFEDPALTIHWRAEGKIEYTGLLFAPGIKPFDLFDPHRRHGVKLFVKRVFITEGAEGLIPPFLRFLRGVVDSEDLPLNVSREMLQNNPMLAKIRQGITRRVLSDIVKFADNAEAYTKFWDDFGAVLKEGLYEDSENRPSLLKALRVRTTKSEGKLTSLADYVSRMKDGQDTLYYINGDSLASIERSPHLEGFKARDIEVLLLTDTVDDFWPAATGEFDGKKFQSVTRAGQDLNRFGKPDTAAEDTKTESSAGQTDPLIALMKKVYGDAVKDVRTSDRLTDSAVCLAVAEGDIDLHLERFLKQHNQIRNDSTRVLELNPQHALIADMAKKASESGAEDKLTNLIWLLLDQAKLLDGESLTDPVAFGKRLGEVMKKAMS